MKFNEIRPALCEEVLEGIETLGFTHMTPVQSATLPLFLTSKDVAVNACTGSGKTIAFVIPMVEMIRKHVLERENPATKINAKCMGLVLSPTRELARQIYDTAMFFFSRALPTVKVTCLVGGSSVEDDLETFRDAVGKYCVVIGTPGRVHDILNRTIGHGVDVKDFEVLVLDEADTLLDMGFQQVIDQILQKLPKQRRTGLFSATQTQEVKALARAGLRNPATICVKLTENEQSTPMTLQNFYTYVPFDQKLSALVEFIQSKKSEKLIVFFSTCAAVDYFGKLITLLFDDGRSHNFVSLHGRMTPKKRIAHYEEFSKSSEGGVLFCTDVVARGIDLPDVDWIVQYDPPTDPSFFVHRVGRTARAGRSGCALTFLAPVEDTYVNFLKIRKIPIAEKELSLTDNINEFTEKVKTLVLSDRDLLEKGTKAFIAFIRSYKEHQCQFIFRFKELDIGAVARNFCLFQLPKMNEFRERKIEFARDSTVDLAQVKFKDKAREKQRQRKYAELLETREKEQTAFEERKKKKAVAAAAAVEKAPRRREKKRGRQQQIHDEWEELANEEMLYKKMKKGKITKEEYEAALEGKNVNDDGDTTDNDDTKTLTKMEERFQKAPKTSQKTKEQKAEHQKREERIKLKKKRQQNRKSQAKSYRKF